MTLEAYRHLRDLGPTVITTAEAAARLKTDKSAASRTLAKLAAAGLILHLRHGLWSLDALAKPETLADEVTRPYPSYVSLVSGLYLREAIDQVPASTHLASLDRSRRISTSRGSFVVHHLPPELFGGFDESRGYKLATVEKAIFDHCYISAASGRVRRRLPEIELPADFDNDELWRWLSLITSKRLRTLTERLITRTVAITALPREKVTVS